MARPRTVVATAVTALVLAAVPSAAQQATDVEVVDSAYDPIEVEVAAGDTVTWTQTGSLPHSVTADDGSFDSHPDCSGGSDCMAEGDTFEVTFDEPGTYPYYCRIHGGPGGVGMSGTVVVTAADATATPTATSTDDGGDTPASTGSIEVADQSGDGTTVAVESVTIEGADGFVVVHLDEDGGPGPVLGHAAIPEGTSTDVVVTLDQPLDEDATVWPMLHVDAGTPGTYEFPGADTPVTVDGEVVMAPLAYTVDAAAADDGATDADESLPETGSSPLGWGLLAALALVAGTVLVRRRLSAG